jgi:hypothetical protein
MGALKMCQTFVHTYPVKINRAPRAATIVRLQHSIASDPPILESTGFATATREG